MMESPPNIFLSSKIKAAFLLVFLGGVVYANAVFNPFIHDDKVFILQNQHISSLQVSSVFLQNSSGLEHSPNIVNAYYRPLVELLYRLEYRAFGFNPHGFHAVNILLHIVNALLLFFVLGKIFTQKNVFVFFVSLIFLIHPLQSESVASIAGVSNILYTFFILLSLNSYLNFSDGKRRLLSGLLCAVFFFLGLLTKEQTVVFPFLLISYELLLSPKPAALKSKWMLWAGMAAFFIVYFCLRHIACGSFLGTEFHWDKEAMLRFLTIPRTILMFMGLIVFPLDLHYYRTISILDPAVGFIQMFVILIIAVALLIMALPDKYKRGFIFGLIWFAVSILPVVNIVPLVVEYSYILTMEHFLYFALIGFLIALGSLAEFMYEWKPIKNILIYVFGIIIFLFSVLTIQLNFSWSNEIELWKRTLNLGNPLGRLHHLLGKAYTEQKMHAEALSEDYKALSIMEGYEQKAAVSVKPVYRNFMEDILFDIANSFQALNRHDLAILHYQKALMLNPLDPRVLNNLGISYFYTHNLDEAKKVFEKAVALDENYVMALNNLGLCYLKESKYDEAKNAFRSVLKIAPNFGSARENLKKLERF